MSYAIDTAATIADLEAAGVAPAHAKAIVRAINGAAGDPVSKDEFKGEMKALRDEFKGEMKALRGEFKATFATKADLEAMKSALTTRIVLAQVATATLLFAMLKFFG